MKWIICDNCPCRNNDYESGATCNLGYDIDLYWFDKKTFEQVKDTPEMRLHQNDFELCDASKGCGLVDVKYANGIYKPQTPRDRLQIAP